MCQVLLLNSTEMANGHDFDTDGTDNPKCPWCGHEHHDDHEFYDGEWTCDKCGSDFHLRRDESVSFKTWVDGDDD